MVSEPTPAAEAAYHYVIFRDGGWVSEHPAGACPLLAGNCAHHEAIARIIGHGAPVEGRWRITGISEGLPDLERVEPQP